MPASIVMTVLATDRPGLVRLLSETVASHGGSWQESRMAHLAGQFAGILRIECPAEKVAGLTSALAALEAEGIAVAIRPQEAVEAAPAESLVLDVVGNDRPGIVRALSAAIAGAGGNVEELSTTLESAPMAGHPLFHARGRVSLPAGAAADGLVSAIENLGPDLSVSIER